MKIGHCGRNPAKPARKSRSSPPGQPKTGHPSNLGEVNPEAVGAITSAPRFRGPDVITGTRLIERDVLKTFIARMAIFANRGASVITIATPAKTVKIAGKVNGACNKLMKFIKRSEMTGQELYESDKERKEAEHMAAGNRKAAADH